MAIYVLTLRFLLLSLAKKETEYYAWFIEKNMINVYQPTFGKEELSALDNVFESNWLGKGKKVAEFEEKYAEHIRMCY